MISFKQFIQKFQTLRFDRDSKTPAPLNGVAFSKVSGNQDWNALGGKHIDIPFIVPKSRAPASGVIVKEKDGRYWVVHPRGQFGGYEATFPKGRVEPELTLEGNAVKEVFEESGLLVRITGHAIDVKKSVTMVRYFFGERIGGDPRTFEDEIEAVSLVPKSKLPSVINNSNDKPILAILK